MTDRNAVVAAFLAERSPANRDAVIAAYQYLCARGARKFRRPDSDPADLEQVAAVGLIKATDAYNAARRTPFEAYAWLMVVGELMHYVRDHERAVRVPRGLRSLERRYVVAWEEVAARTHAEPTTAQLAAALAVSPRTIEELRAMRRGNRIPEPDADTPRAVFQCDALPAPSTGLPFEDRLTVRLALEALEQRERTVVLGTYAAGLSQSEIGAKIGLSQSQVSKILGRALGKLQQCVA
jgi:RNA polymerase sigma-B factor